LILSDKHVLNLDVSKGILIMNEDSTETYFSPSLGSISGFTRGEHPDGSDLVQTGFSLTELLAFLNNDRGLNFPTEDFVRHVNDLINDHKNDFDNPHKVTLAQISNNFTNQILGTLFPGTAPVLPPFFSYESDFPLPMNTIFPAAYTNTNLYRRTGRGSFVNPLAEENVVGVDYITNASGLPFFSSLTNLVPVNWLNVANARINTSSHISTHADTSFPFDTYLIQETNSSGEFGVGVVGNNPQGAVCTFTAFISGTLSKGKVVLYQSGDTDSTMTLDLSNGSYVMSDATVMGEAYVYPSGDIRVSFTYTVGSQGVSSKVCVVHLNDGDTSTVRNGIEARPIFRMGNPIITNGPLNQPALIDNTVVGSTSTLIPDKVKLGIPDKLSSLMISMSMDLYPTFPSAGFVDKTLFTMGTLVIERDHKTIYVKVAGVTMFSSDILPGLNIITLSYGLDRLIFKDLKDLRRVQLGPFPALVTAGCAVGRFGGYLKSLALYAQSDKEKCVEFLTNG
jgi:hypothetical protein